MIALPRGYKIHGFHEETTRFTKEVANSSQGHVRLSIFLFRSSLFLGKPISIYASASGKSSYSGFDILTAQSGGIEKEEESLAGFKR